AAGKHTAPTTIASISVRHVRVAGRRDSNAVPLWELEAEASGVVFFIPSPPSESLTFSPNRLDSRLDALRLSGQSLSRLQHHQHLRETRRFCNHEIRFADELLLESRKSLRTPRQHPFMMRPGRRQRRNAAKQEPFGTTLKARRPGYSRQAPRRGSRR